MGIRDWLRGEEIEETESDAFDEVVEDRLDALGDVVRQKQIEEIDNLTESLRDARAELMHREVMAEDNQTSGWRLLEAFQNGTLTDLHIRHETRVKRNNLAEKTWREDPVVGRGVGTMNEYVWGRGLPLPRALDPRVQRIIRSVWEDPENKLILTSYEAQVCKGTELSLYGELFLVVFTDDESRWKREDIDIYDEHGRVVSSEVDGATTDGDGGGAPTKPTSMLLPPGDDPSGGTPGPGASEGADEPLIPEPPIPPSAVRLGQIHPNEITDVIPDKDNAAKPRYYKRVSAVRSYDYNNDSWVYDKSNKKVTYFEDIIHPPEEGQSAPPDSKVGDGKILHLTTNRTSFQLRGNSELWRAVRWAQALNDFFTWRMTLLKANSVYLFKQKVVGGPQAVRQASQRLAAGPGRTGVPGDYDPLAPPGRGSVLVENQNSTLEQFKTTSGAGEAEQDSQMLRGQVGVSIGLPIHYLGDKGSANLANATAMEAPVLKMMEARQELFEQGVTKFLNFCIDKAIDDGALPEDVDRTFYVEMPNIMQRSIPELVASLTNTTARLDPFAQDIRLKRLTLQQVLTWLGYPDPDSIVREIYPPGTEDQQQPMQPGAEGIDPNLVGDDGVMTPGQGPDAPGFWGPPVGGAGGGPRGPQGPLTPPAGMFPNGMPSTPGPAPEPLTGQQPYPGAHTGVTMNNGQGLGA